MTTALKLNWKAWIIVLILAMLAGCTGHYNSPPAAIDSIALDHSGS